MIATFSTKTDEFLVKVMIFALKAMDFAAVMRKDWGVLCI